MGDPCTGARTADPSKGKSIRSGALAPSAGYICKWPFRPPCQEDRCLPSKAAYTGVGGGGGTPAWVWGQASQVGAQVSPLAT